MSFDALILVSFGGPEGPDEVMPFLRRVVRGRPVPPERLEQVADQYGRFGGVSPINDQNRRLLASLRLAFDEAGRRIPLYWGNRNWHPFLADTLARMRDDGIGRAAAFVTSAYSSYSSCRQYLEDIEAARRTVGSGAPEVFKLRPFFDHPGFVEPLRDGVLAGCHGAAATPGGSALLMAAHSIPISMAVACDYERQLRHVAELVAPAGGPPWQLVFQSRSGPSSQPWLEPDINDAIRSLPGDLSTVVVAPIGFVSDHMEVVYDLDVVAAESAQERGFRFVRSPTPGTDPRFVRMVVDLLAEAEAETDGAAGERPGTCCHPGCCPFPYAGSPPG